MPDYWRFTRNQYTRRIYDALKALGVTATRMNEYRAELEQTKLTRSPPLPAGVALDFVSAAEADSLDVDFDFSLSVNMLDGEWAVIATVDERPIDRTLVTDTSKPYVDPPEREVPALLKYSVVDTFCPVPINTDKVSVERRSPSNRSLTLPRVFAIRHKS